MPLSVVLLLQALGVILLARRRPRAALVSLVTAAGLLLGASSEGIADRLLLPLEAHYPPAYAYALPSPEAAPGRARAPAPLAPALASCRFILVLGGGNHGDRRQAAIGRLAPSSLGRLTEAVRLAHLLPSSRLLFCGPAGEGQTDSHAAVLATAAVELGLARDRITLLTEGRDTHDEVAAARAVAGDAPVALVTSAWHMPRAMGLARGVGLHAVACPADFALTPDGVRPNPWFKFSLGGLDRSTKAVHEYLGLLWTRLRGQR